MNAPIVFFIALSTFATTLLGGLFALKFKDKLHTILGFSAGTIIGLVFFDLLPEALEIGGDSGVDAHTILAITLIGFLGYMLLDRYVLIHSHNDDHDHHCENKHHHATHPRKGSFGALSFALHSFIDGVVIGLGFQLSEAIGVIVAVAILIHDFSDGLNTVNIILKSGGNRKRAMRWLIIDALAPILGVLSTFLFTLPEQSIGMLLAAFSGFFLYIGATEMLPESHHGHALWYPSIMTILGASIIFIAVKLAGH